MARTLSKPAGVPVLRPHADPRGDCLLQRLLLEEPWRAAHDWPAGFEGGLCHRLDTSTSGAVLVADDVAELAAIRAAFAEHALVKTYALRVARAPTWTSNACARPIAHDKRKRGRMIVQRGNETPHRGAWLSAHTAFTVVEGDLLLARMTTGVMHQIRVHAAFLGVPLLGDPTYGGGPTPAEAPPGLTFYLHHYGLVARQPGGLRSDPVPLPAWAQAAAASLQRG